jgi:hypothetical protein
MWEDMKEDIFKNKIWQAGMLMYIAGGIAFQAGAGWGILIAVGAWFAYNKLTGMWGN